MTDEPKPLTDEDLHVIEARARDHCSALIDRSSSEGGPVSWRNPLASDVVRLVAEVRRLRDHECPPCADCGVGYVE